MTHCFPLLLPGASCAGNPTLPLRWLPYRRTSQFHTRKRRLWSSSRSPRSISYRFYVPNPKSFFTGPEIRGKASEKDFHSPWRREEKTTFLSPRMLLQEKCTLSHFLRDGQCFHLYRECHHLISFLPYPWLLSGCWELLSLVHLLTLSDIIKDKAAWSIFTF